MRQTPKHVIFPALRLIRERQKRSKKRMRIKNWLLLLARMALLALMALALARPRLYLADAAGRRVGPHGARPGLRHQPVDGLQGEGQDPARRGQGAGPGDPRQDPRLEPGLRGRLGRAGRAARPVAGRGPEADRRADDPPGQPAAQRRDGPGLPGGRRVRPAAARGLRADRPGPLVLEPRAARRGPRPGREGQDDSRRQDRDLHPPAGLAARSTTSRSTRPNRPRTSRPRASRSRSGARSTPRAPSPRAASSSSISTA